MCNFHCTKNKYVQMKLQNKGVIKKHTTLYKALPLNAWMFFV